MAMAENRYSVTGPATWNSNGPGRTGPTQIGARRAVAPIGHGPGACADRDLVEYFDREIGLAIRRGFAQFHAYSLRFLLSGCPQEGADPTSQQAAPCCIDGHFTEP